MPSVIVTRFEGDVQGEPIVEPLAASESALIQRGRREIEELSLDSVEIPVVVPYNKDVKIGSLVGIIEASSGKRRVGKITKITHSFSGTRVSSNVILRLVVT